MDWIALRSKAADVLKKYRYALLVLLLGLALMLLPGKKETAGTEPVETSVQQEQPDTESQLAQILSQIKGAGKVEVMLTVAAGEQTIYQTDEDIDAGENGSSRFDTVIVTDAQRAQSGLIQQINPPRYQGAIIVCQGAEDPSVRLAIAEAVSRVTGLGTDRIAVLKMK